MRKQPKSTDTVPAQLDTDLIAVLRLRGELSLESAIVADLTNVFPQVSSDNHVALIVSIDSPGGTLATAQMLGGWIRKLYKSKGKPVICVIEERCLSAGLAVAVECDHIYAPPAALLGSFGVMMDWPQAAEFRKSLGMVTRTYASTRFKDMTSPNRVPNEEDDACIESVLSDLHEQFAGHIRRNRPKITDEDFAVFSDGRLITGHRACNHGLIDGLGGMEAAIAHLQKQGLCPENNLPEFIFLGDPTPQVKAQSGLSGIMDFIKGLANG